MNEKKSCAVEYLGPYLDKWVNVKEKGDEGFTLYKVNNVYADGTLELITQASDDTDGDVFVEFINVRDIQKIAIDIADTDIEAPTE
jgi:hypothetical protein